MCIDTKSLLRHLPLARPVDILHVNFSHHSNRSFASYLSAFFVLCCCLDLHDFPFRIQINWPCRDPISCCSASPSLCVVWLSLFIYRFTLLQQSRILLLMPLRRCHRPYATMAIFVVVDVCKFQHLLSGIADCCKATFRPLRIVKLKKTKMTGTLRNFGGAF